MSEIIYLWDTRENMVRRNHEEKVPVENALDKLIIQTPSNIESIITSNLWSREIISIWLEKFKALIMDYVIYHLTHAKIKIEWWVILWLQYVTELLFKILIPNDEEIKAIIDNPYYMYWMNEGFPKRAWDASIYAFMFKSFMRKPIDRECYISFAQNAYFEHSNDFDFATGIWEVLPPIQNMMRDSRFLSRSDI